MRTSNLLSAFATFLLLMSLIPAQQTFSAPGDPLDLFQSLRQQTDNQVRIANHKATGKVRFIGTDLAHPIHQSAALPASASREDAARGFLSTYGALFGLTSPKQELTVKRQTTPDKQRTFVRFQQVHKSVPVFGGELVVQLDGANNVISANGEVLPDITVSTLPAIDSAAAGHTAREAVAKWYGVDASALSAS